ncbi:MAG TPA: agmatinase [Actinomycetota bacterium]|nr:agmatinase [Actinomycetota bacterium]
MDVRFTEQGGFVGPPDGRQFPRFMGPSTFARLPRIDQVDRWDVAVVGVPFDIGTSYRPGARFGPIGIRQGSRMIRNWHPALAVAPFGTQQVVDAGDIPCSAFVIDDAVAAIERGAEELAETSGTLIALGGDHTIAFPLLRAARRRHGPVALVHFDAHVDTYDTYMGAPLTHGTPFRRAAEEKLFDKDRSMHVGVRGPKFGPEDLIEDAGFGFVTMGTWEIESIGIQGYVERIRERVGDAPLYVSIDIDVLDPAFAPATGTPEAGGFSSRELLGILRGLRGLHLVGADIVEVAPAYDHAEITSIAAANVAYELISLLAPGTATGSSP